MRRRTTLFHLTLAALTCGLSSVSAHAQPQARIEAIDPGDGSTLALQQSLNVRIAYTTNEPISLWARPFVRGKEVKEIFANASAEYTGSGEALGWFALTKDGTIDEIRVRAGGGNPYREWELATLPVSLSWAADSRADTRVAPAWVGELQADATARLDRRMKEEASKPTTAGDVALFNGFMLTMLAVGLAGIVVPLWSWWKWRGAWRIAAAVPAAVVLFVILRIVVDTARDPTSHNLWPFEIVMISALALGAIGILKIVRRFVGVQA